MKVIERPDIYEIFCSPRIFQPHSIECDMLDDIEEMLNEKINSYVFHLQQIGG